MGRIKLLVVGHARHGKDTFGEIARDNFKLNFESSSEFMCERVIFPMLKEEHSYKTALECFKDRINHRDKWFKIITEFNTPDLTRLSRNILKEAEIYVGMRNAEELKASRHLFDLVVWVDASERLGSEPSSSMTITSDMCDVILTNNETLNKFKTKVITFLKTLKNV